MKNKIIYLVLLFLFLTATTSILAQEECGTELTQVQIDYMNATREARKNLNVVQLKNNTATIIPMVVHIIRDNNGNGGLSTTDLNIAMANLNEAFKQVGFEFDLCQINYINNTAYTAVEKSFEQGSVEYQMGANRVLGKVNVFFAANISGSGWASFPGFKNGYDKDWIVIKNSAATKSTFAHELGHWFNLYHTHEKDWTEHIDHGVGITEAELVRRGAGGNCGNAQVGDELCGTPADPLLKYNVRDDCAYIGNSEDDNNDLYTPDTHNIMSYSIGKCRTSFSSDQIERMQDSYQFDRMSSLSPCTTSLGCEITAISVSNTKTCNDNGTPGDTTDDYFKGTVSVYYIGKPNSGQLRMRVTGGTTRATSNFDGNKHTFILVSMPANGQPIEIEAYFTESDCSFTDNNVHRGTSCGPCHINEPTLAWATFCNDNDTPEVTDDFFEARINVTCSNWPTSGTLDITNITNDVLLSIPVNQLNNDKEYHQLPYAVFPANGQPISLTATFSDATCSATNTVAGTYPCSDDCRHNANITEEISNIYTKEVHNWIKASNKILSGADATYDARVKITLEPGFHAHNGSKFHAYIDGCPDNIENKEEPLISELDTTVGYLRNYPNPFTGQTTIEFELSKDTPVTLFISDVTGKQITTLLNNDQKTEGTHSVTFDGNNYPAGMYYYTIQTGEYYGTQKMILVK